MQHHRAMTSAEKLLARIRNNPRDWLIGQLETVAQRYGLKVRKPDGSHVIFQKDGCRLEVSVPAHKPIKPVYIRQFLALIDFEVRP
jgi:predicted RNA binding protein YcfA (HicA-like mRNA interferase family)